MDWDFQVLFSTFPYCDHFTRTSVKLSPTQTEGVDLTRVLQKEHRTDQEASMGRGKKDSKSSRFLSIIF